MGFWAMNPRIVSVAYCRRTLLQWSTAIAAKLDFSLTPILAQRRQSLPCGRARNRW